jgi:hypothetical protein
MIAALLLIAAQDVPAAAPQAEDEITVIARKLKAWRGSLKFEKGVATCKVRSSSGDREIDAIGCAAMTTCFPRYMPRFEAVLANKTLDAEARKRANAPINAEVTACFTAEHEAGIKALADKRAAK